MRASMRVLVFLACCAGGYLPGATQEPKAKDEAVSPRQWREFLGKDHLSEEVHGARERFREKPKARYGQDAKSGFALNWYKTGLSLQFRSDNTLAAVLLHAGKSEPFALYKGELPDGLSFDDTAEAVEKKLGKPSKAIDRPERGNSAYQYAGKGLTITFTTKDLAATKKATIDSIRLHDPKKP
jgi:hypothetical protein